MMRQSKAKQESDVSNPFAERREEIGKTQRRVAEEINAELRTTLTPQAISAWENGKAVPNAMMYDAVAKAYERSRAWVVEACIHIGSKNAALSGAA